MPDDNKIAAEYREAMNYLARGIDRLFNGRDEHKNTGFVLLVFPFGETEGRRANYISNASRKDIVSTLKEIAARFEGQPEVSGTA